MIKIFTIDPLSNIVKLIPEALLLEPFSVIYKADKSKDKALAIKELAFVYWFGVFDSIYDSYDELEKKLRIKKEVQLPDNWEMNDAVKNAIAFYIESQKTRSTKYLESTKKAVESLASYLEAIDVNERINSGSKKGELVHDINKVKAMVKDMPEMIKAMNEIKAMVAEELKEEQINRAGRRTNKYNE